ncbi:hypothetical protein BLNAU_10961 [Blattamonas nauphoetae]|uniref:Uncharacterized protein n=1 Tax=Blattamonas nauphoetae TaxID=2049346 RepID=A0ABQ9XSF5_9EUKA|nr:hypothetical protein BLNAU_10961 [Blattamonas nauphoetae]
MDFVLHMPVVLAIPSCLTFFEKEEPIWYVLFQMYNTQLYWNETKGEFRQMWKTVHRVLGMEGMEDVIEEKLQNDKNTNGGWIIGKSIDWNNLHGMNRPNRR